MGPPAARLEHLLCRTVAVLVAAPASEGALRQGLGPCVGARLLPGMVSSISEWYRPGGPRTAAELAGMASTVGLHGEGGAARLSAARAGGAMIDS